MAKKQKSSERAICPHCNKELTRATINKHLKEAGTLKTKTGQQNLLDVSQKGIQKPGIKTNSHVGIESVGLANLERRVRN